MLKFGLRSPWFCLMIGIFLMIGIVILFFWGRILVILSEIFWKRNNDFLTNSVFIWEKKNQKAFFISPKWAKFCIIVHWEFFFFFPPSVCFSNFFCKITPKKRNYQKKSLMETQVNLKTILNPKLPITTQWNNSVCPTGLVGPRWPVSLCSLGAQVACFRST